jgi:hypothetical protein
MKVRCRPTLDTPPQDIWNGTVHRIPGPRSRGGFYRTLAWFLVIISLGATLHCDSDDTVNSMWTGTYKFSDTSGDATGSVTFVVTASNDIFCFVFSGSAAIYSTPCGNSVTQSVPINGVQFSVPLTTSQGSFTLNGQFLSSTQASGQVVGPGDTSDAVLTWTATETQVGKMSRIEDAHSGR